MTTMTMDAHLSALVGVDLCASCHGFWFDKYESLKLSAGSTLKLIKLIGEHTAAGKPQPSSKPQCPRCAVPLVLTNDMQRSTRFRYFRCQKGHGRFIGYFDFLREKNFIRALSQEQIRELRRNVQILNCSNCAAPIDLTKTSACEHCGSPLSMLDMSQPQELLKELEQAAQPKPISPSLPYDLAMAKRDMERMFGPRQPGEPDLWGAPSSPGLVEAGLSALVRWLKTDLD